MNYKHAIYDAHINLSAIEVFQIGLCSFDLQHFQVNDRNVHHYSIIQQDFYFPSLYCLFITLWMIKALLNKFITPLVPNVLESQKIINAFIRWCLAIVKAIQFIS